MTGIETVLIEVAAMLDMDQLEEPQMRWTPQGKENLLKQIDQGLISPEEAMVQHGISPEELASWRQLYTKWGHRGLRTTLTQSYLPKSQRTLQ